MFRILRPVPSSCRENLQNALCLSGSMSWCFLLYLVPRKFPIQTSYPASARIKARLLSSETTQQ